MMERETKADGDFGCEALLQGHDVFINLVKSRLTKLQVTSIHQLMWFLLSYARNLQFTMLHFNIAPYGRELLTALNNE